MTAIQDIAEKVRPIMKKYGVKRARVFGSYARGTQNLESDVDLLIETKETLSLWDMVGLRDDLTSELGKSVDIVTDESVLPILRDSIYKHTETVYEG